MSFTIRLLIWFKGKYVGKDSFDNSYYEEKSKRVYSGRQPRRWVIYSDVCDASKVPPEWHAWLHYRSDEPLNGQVYAWQKPHQPNLTGTASAYKPESVEGGKVIRLTTKMKRPYQPWTPNE
jgi:NADH:ubiquinone oxidoreductase subunit